MDAQLFVDSVVAINIVGSVYVSVLIGLWLYRRRMERPLKMNGFLMLLSFFPAMLVISLSHASWTQGSWIGNFLHWLELLFTITAGPLILALVWGSAVNSLRLALAIVVSGFSATLLLLAGLDRFIPFLPALFTLGSIALLVKRGFTSSARIQRLLLATALLIHLAQLIRFLGRDIVWLQEIVPLTATLMGLAWLGWHLQRRHRPVAAPEKTGLSPGIFSSLDAHVRNTEAFRNPDLSLGALAVEIRLPPYLVSQAVNQHAGRFRDYINTYRVNTFLREYSPQSKVEILAYQAGFRSRSAFYRAFKASTGQTPSQYYAATCPDS